MNRISIPAEIGESIRLTAHISAVAQTAVVILSIPSIASTNSLGTIGRLTLCAFLTLPSFLPFLFPEIRHQLNRLLSSERLRDPLFLLLLVFTAASFLPGAIRALAMVVIWPAVALAFLTRCHAPQTGYAWIAEAIVLLAISLLPTPVRAITPPALYLLAKVLPGTPESEDIAAPASNQPSTFALLCLAPLGITLAETQLTCGPTDTNLMQASVSLLLLTVGSLPLAIFLYRRQARAKAASILACTAIALLLFCSHKSLAVYETSLSLTTTWMFLLLQAVATCTTSQEISQAEEPVRTFYALCSLPFLTAIEHMFLSMAYFNDNVLMTDQFMVLLSLLIGCAPCLIALFLKLSARALPSKQGDQSTQQIEKIERALDDGTLASQELRVAARMCMGKSFDDIGEDLGIHRSTVGTYANRIYRHLGVGNREEAETKLRTLLNFNFDDEDIDEPAEASPEQPSFFRRKAPIICTTALAMQILLLHGVLTDFLRTPNQEIDVTSFETAALPLVVGACLIFACIALAVFTLFRAKNQIGPELCCTAFLAIVIACNNFIVVDEPFQTTALLLHKIMLTLAACCSAICLVALAQRSTDLSKKQVGALVLVAICLVGLQQISELRGALTVLYLALTAAAICMAPLKKKQPQFLYSMNPPLRALTAMPFVGFSIHIVLYAANNLAYQIQLISTVFSLAGLVLLFAGAIFVASCTKKLEEPIYTPLVICVVTTIPGLAFGNLCTLRCPATSVPMLLPCGITLFVACMPEVRNTIKVILLRKNLACSTDDTFLQELLLRHGLTGAEAQTTSLAVRGLSVKQIAAELTVSQNTVRSHIQHTYQKLGVHSREALARQVDLLYQQSVNRISETRSLPATV